MQSFHSTEPIALILISIKSPPLHSHCLWFLEVLTGTHSRWDPIVNLCERPHNIVVGNLGKGPAPTSGDCVLFCHLLVVKPSLVGKIGRVKLFPSL